MAAVGEEDDEADQQPDAEADPGHYVEEGHHAKADQDAEDRHQRYQRGAVGPFGLRIGPAHYDDTDTDDYERQKGTDTGEMAEVGDRHEAAQQDHKQHHYE